MEVKLEGGGFYFKFGMEMSSKTAFCIFIWNQYLKYNRFYAIFKKKEKMRGFYLYTLYILLKECRGDVKGPDLQFIIGNP